MCKLGEQEVSTTPNLQGPIFAVGHMAKAKMVRKKTATTKAAAAPSSAARAVRGDDGDGKFPRGYVPVRLVAGDGEEHERVLVPVALLNEPRMAELLEMAERRFGYGQPGVLRIPCDARRFQRLIVGLPCVAT